MTTPAPREPTRHEMEVEVRYAETDQMGVVHHSNYLVWFELARTGLCRLTGVPYDEIERRGAWLMVTAAHLSYRGGARYGDTVRVTCWLAKLKSRILEFAYEVSCNGALLATGSTEHVWVDAATKRPRRIPEELQAPFERLAG